MSTIGHWTRRKSRTDTVYQVIDRLHAGACGAGAERPDRRHGFRLTGRAWCGPMVEDLARAVRTGNWAAAHALEDLLSVDILVGA